MNKDASQSDLDLNLEALRDLGELRYDEPLSPHTSWHIGGPARCYFRPNNIAGLSAFLKQLPLHEPITFLGLGSNVLISDQGIAGTVIHTLGMDAGEEALKLIAPLQVRASAGVTAAKLAKFCSKEGLLGADFFAGIPGTVGGALTMNAGAFGGETWENVLAVEVIDRQGNIIQKTKSDFIIEYRSVRPKVAEAADTHVELGFVSGLFQFQKGVVETATQNIKQLLKKRSDSQPIGSFNCGSVFKNPPNDYAARLIEACGLKGMQIGDAEVSLKHANFIINKGQAKAEEVLALIHHIIKTVYEKFGIELKPEVKFLGWDPIVLQQALSHSS